VLGNPLQRPMDKPTVKRLTTAGSSWTLREAGPTEVGDHEDLGLDLDSPVEEARMSINLSLAESPLLVKSVITTTEVMTEMEET